MKKQILVIGLVLTAGILHAQVQVNNGTNSGIANSNVLLDGSTSFSKESGAQANTGKGIVIPSVDLVNFQFDLTLADGVTFPTYFDGMMVYNSATGNTLTAGNRPSQSTAVTPGFYYFSNPNGASNGNVTGGQWKPLGQSAIAAMTAGNGLTTASGHVKLGGTLSEPTTLTTDATNTLKVLGLQNGALTDQIITKDANGVLKSVDRSTFDADLRLVGTNSHITKDAGVGGTGTSTGTGNDNIAIGQYALYSNTTGANNVATGSFNLGFNTTGTNNVATGVNALNENTTGNNNIATGVEALSSNRTGSNNIATGNQALFANLAGDGNVATGSSALSGTNGSNNVAIGFDSGTNLATGDANVFLGAHVGFTNPGTTASNQLFIGNATGDDVLLRGDFNTKVLTINNTLKVTDLNSTATITSGNRPVVADANGQLMIGAATSSSTTASNGLTAASNDVKLGGTLTQATNVAMAGNNLSLSGTGKMLVGTNTVPAGGTNAKVVINNGTTNGALQIVDGSQGQGKILVSDANGVGTWQSTSGTALIVNSTGGGNVSITTSLQSTGATATVTVPGYYIITTRLITDKNTTGGTFYLAYNFIRDFGVTNSWYAFPGQDAHQPAGPANDFLYTSQICYLPAGVYTFVVRTWFTAAGNTSITRNGFYNNSFTLTLLK